MANDESTSEVTGSGQAEGDDEYLATPWHFKLLVVAFVLYLIYRGVQLVAWLLDKI